MLRNRLRESVSTVGSKLTSKTKPRGGMEAPLGMRYSTSPFKRQPERSTGVLVML